MTSPFARVLRVALSLLLGAASPGAAQLAKAVTVRPTLVLPSAPLVTLSPQLTAPALSLPVAPTLALPSANLASPAVRPALPSAVKASVSAAVLAASP
ncbi:MAG: hypothetical protein FD126_1743, partial [Elusimicrobia bacterium]